MQAINWILILLIIVVIVYYVQCARDDHDDDDHHHEEEHHHVKHSSDMDAWMPSTDAPKAESAGITEAWDSLTHGGEPPAVVDTAGDDDAQLRQALRATLRDGVSAVEENLVELSDDVKNAFTTPSANAIRESAHRARSMMLPEISTRKVDGMGGEIQLFKGRDPTATLEVQRDAPEWGVTDAWLYQKEQAATGR